MGLIDQSALSQTLPARSSIWAKSILSTYDTPGWLLQMCPVHQKLTMPLVGVIIFSPNKTFCKLTKPPITTTTVAVTDGLVVCPSQNPSRTSFLCLPLTRLTPAA